MHILIFRHGITHERIERATIIRQSVNGANNNNNNNNDEENTVLLASSSIMAQSEDAKDYKLNAQSNAYALPDRDTHAAIIDSLIETPPKYWYITHRFLITTRFLVPLFIGLVVTSVVIGMIVEYFAPIGTTIVFGCPINPSSNILLRTLQFAIILVLLLQAYKMREVVEGFYIKREMIHTAGTAFVLILSFVLYGAIKSLSHINEHVFPLSSLSGYLLALLFTTYSVMVPLHYSIVTQPKLHIERQVPRNISTLQELLRHHMGVTAFKEFLSREFSVENLLFVEVVSDYQIRSAEMRHHPSPVWRKTQTSIAKVIYEKYVKPNAPYQVNLPGRLLNRIQMVLDTVKMADSIPEPRRSLILHDAESVNLDTVFDEAQKDVFALMESDSFRRFLISDICREMLLSARKKAREHVILKDMKFV